MMRDSEFVTGAARGGAALDEIAQRLYGSSDRATANDHDDPRADVPPQGDDAPAGRYRFLDYDRAKLPATLFAQRPPPYPFVIEGLLPEAPGLFVAAGGTGKTRLTLWEAVHIILGRDFLGHKVREGRVLFVTAEDDREVFDARLYDLAEAMELTANQRKLILDRLLVLDVTGLDARLVETDMAHNLVQTGVVPALIERYRNRDIRLINLDPVSNLGPGEIHGNDGASRFLTACWRLSKSIGCAVRGIHHVAKAVARDGTLDQHAGRGGSAFADNSRHVWQLTYAGQQASNPPEVVAAAIDGAPLRLDVHKVSYCRRPEQPFYLTDHGAAFQQIAVSTETVDTLARDLDTLCALLTADRLAGRRHSRRNVEELPAERRRGLGRDRIRAIVAEGLATGRLIEEPLPKEEQVGARKSVLSVAPNPRNTRAMAPDEVQQ